MALKISGPQTSFTRVMKNNEDRKKMFSTLKIRKQVEDSPENGGQVFTNQRGSITGH